MTTANLRFAPDILRRLGEELVPHPDLGVMELVRNAYDADAPTCTIDLHNVDAPGGRVTVTDSGDGMTIRDILAGWLLLGRSPKTESTHTRLNRRKVGEKGLGRLAALRLGGNVVLTTRPREEPGKEHVLTIDWRAYDSAEAVEDVPLSITTRSTESSCGTEIEINNISQPFSEADVNRLARSVILLTGPFPGPTDFDVSLNSVEFQELAELVRTKYFDEYEYFLAAKIDEDGQASAVMRNWQGDIVAEGNHARISSSKDKGRAQPSLQYYAPVASFELWTFNLSAENFSVRNSNRTVREVQQWLGEVGGVHLYHRGLRVHPYGDVGHDWLDMNLRRVRSPEVRPSTNNSVGRVSLNDEENKLVPKTDRMGFLENASFESLAEFGRNVLDWAAQERIAIRDRAKQATKDNSKTRTNSAWHKVEDTIRSLPPSHRKAVRAATDELRAAYDEKIQTVEQDLLLYRTLGTVGTTTAVFAHETKHPVDIISSVTKSIDRRVKRLVTDELYRDQLQEPIDSIRSATATLTTYAEIPLKLLQRRKRRLTAVDVEQVTSDVLDLFRPHLERSGIVVRAEYSGKTPRVKTMVALVEAILANLLTNAMYAFTLPLPNQHVERIILIRCLIADAMLVITVADSGPGIDEAKVGVEDIWLPGMTTREDGTGLGLTIVRDVVNEMKGRAVAKARGELGGAEFVVEIPRIVE